MDFYMIFTLKFFGKFSVNLQKNHNMVKKLSVKLDLLKINLSIIYRVNSPNTGCLSNIGNGPQSGPPLYGKAEGRFAALHFIMGRRAAKWLIIV